MNERRRSSADMACGGSEEVCYEEAALRRELGSWMSGLGRECQLTSILKAGMLQGGE